MVYGIFASTLGSNMMQFLQLVGIIMISNSTLVLVLEVYYCIQQPAKHQSLKLKNIHQRAPLDGECFFLYFITYIYSLNYVFLQRIWDYKSTQDFPVC